MRDGGICRIAVDKLNLFLQFYIQHYKSSHALETERLSLSGLEIKRSELCERVDLQQGCSELIIS